MAGLSLVEDGLVIDLRGMGDIEVDPQRRIARVGGGATWAAVDRATGPTAWLPPVDAPRRPAWPG